MTTYLQFLHSPCARITLLLLLVSGCTTLSPSLDSVSHVTKEEEPSYNSPYGSKSRKIYEDRDYRFLKSEPKKYDSFRFKGMPHYRTELYLDQLEYLAVNDPKFYSVQEYCSLMMFCTSYDALERKQVEYQSIYVQLLLDRYQPLWSQVKHAYEYEKHVQQFCRDLNGENYYWEENTCALSYASKDDGFRYIDSEFLTILEYGQVLSRLPEDDRKGLWMTTPYFDKAYTAEGKSISPVLGSKIERIYPDFRSVSSNEHLYHLCNKKYLHTLAYAEDTTNQLMLDFLKKARLVLDIYEPRIADAKRKYVHSRQMDLAENYKTRGFSSDRFRVSKLAGVSVESVAVYEKHVDVEVDYHVMPFSPSQFGAVVASLNEIDLGPPVEMQALSKRRDSDGYNEIKYRCRFEGRAPFNTNGQIRIFILNSGVELESLVNYTEIDGSVAPVVLDNKVISCRREGNHLIVPARLFINGQSVCADLLLDTGASMTTISKGIYYRGNPKPLSSLSKMRFNTANGPVWSPVDMLEVEVGDVRKDLKVSISEENIGLLGADFFDGYLYTIDLDKEEIRISTSRTVSSR